MKNFSKNIVRSLISKILHPAARIRFGSYIDSKSQIKGILTVGYWSEVLQSKIEGYVSIGDKCKILKVNIQSNVRISNKCRIDKTSIGKFTYITEDARIHFCKIGKFCSIGPGLMCGLGKHPTDWISTSPIFYSTKNPCKVSFSKNNCFQEEEQTKIGNDVHIGARAFLKDGVVIGDGAIIGSGAVVVNDVPDYAVVGGIPANVIRFRFKESERQSLKETKWWDWPEETLQKMQFKFVQSDVVELLRVLK